MDTFISYAVTGIGYTGLILIILASYYYIVGIYVKVIHKRRSRIMSNTLNRLRSRAEKLFNLGLITEEQYKTQMKLTAKNHSVPVVKPKNKKSIWCIIKGVFKK